MQVEKIQSAWQQHCAAAVLQSGADAPNARLYQERMTQLAGRLESILAGAVSGQSLGKLADHISGILRKVCSQCLSWTYTLLTI